jgi:hypothetical protein
MFKMKSTSDLSTNDSLHIYLENNYNNYNNNNNNNNNLNNPQLSNRTLLILTSNKKQHDESAKVNDFKTYKKNGILGHRIMPLETNLSTPRHNMNNKKNEVKPTMNKVNNGLSISLLNLNEERVLSETTSIFPFRTPSLEKISEKVKQMSRQNSVILEQEINKSQNNNQTKTYTSISTPTKIIYHLSKLHKSDKRKSIPDFTSNSSETLNVSNDKISIIKRPHLNIKDDLEQLAHNKEESSSDKSLKYKNNNIATLIDFSTDL